MSTALIERACPKCGVTVKMTATRLKHGKYACNACSNAAVSEWASRNRERFLESARKRTLKYQAAHPEKRPSAKAKSSYDRQHRLKQKYGLTPAEYERLLAAQGGACAICRTTEPRAMFDRWHIDHCHDTGRIRGLLCARCNLGLGCLGDTLADLERARQYLIRFQKEGVA